jgi:pantoate--beta-alanine ligase
MRIIRSPVTAQRFSRRAARPLVLVPTMGALHEGHVALIERAREIAGKSGLVAVSIFVNPTQFGPSEDFGRYPRPITRDLQLCRESGVDVVFNPSVDQMYGPDFSTYVEETQLSRGLCGKTRPGHFRGVCTVVSKLFAILRPDAAVFGLKDYQQVAVIKRMVRDLHLPVRIVAAQTVREADGLAVSSRNAYLNGQERAQAPAVRRALLRAAKLAKSGETHPDKLKKIVLETLSAEAPLARIDYVEIIDPVTLQPVADTWRHAVIAIAVYLGATRLIDNVRLR